jgi:Rod binding domain-containing protein
MSGILAVAPSISAMTATPASTTTPSAALGTAFGAALATGGANLAATQRHARLVDAAQQFEGMMLEQLLKPLQKSQDTGFGGDSDTDPDADRDGSLDTLSSYGTEAVANSIARSGGLGIARKLVADVDRIDTRIDTGIEGQTQNTQRSQPSPVTQVIR